MTHLQWPCELKGYLCYICRSSFQVILGRLQWNGAGGLSIMTSDKTVHSGYNPSTLTNDIALLRLPNPVTFTSEYPVQCCECVVRPHHKRWSADRAPTINYGGEVLFIISKGKCSSVSRKFSTVLYVLN